MKRIIRLLIALLAVACLLTVSLSSCNTPKTPKEKPGEAITPIGDRSYDEFIDESGNSLGACYVIHADLVEVAKDYERSWYICEYEGYRIKVDQPLPKEFSCDDLNLEITYLLSDLSVSEDGEMYVIAKAMRVQETPTWYDPNVTYDKPVIYLYPESPTTVDVRVNFKGEFTVTIPEYHNGWTVTAHPDGTLISEDGEKYPYLFWEGVPEASVLTFSEGFCVRGEDTAAFLGDILPRLGLNETESADFMEYWLPRMQDNAYNVIRFNDPAYMEMASMDIFPAPDTVIRVFMSYTTSEAYVALPTQEIVTPSRCGFAVVEWGGCEMK